MFGPGEYALEEIEREEYKRRDVWSITLSFSRWLDGENAIDEIAPRRDYKRFLIDVQAGDFHAMKIREVAIH